MKHIASNAMTLHTIFCCHFGTKILQSRFLQVDLFDWEHSSFFRCLSETFFFQSAHLRDTSSQALLTIHHKKCHRHVHRPPATILHSMTNCAIGSQSFLLQISFLANFEGKMLLSKRRWTRCTLWTRFSEPPTRRKVRKKALRTFTQLRKCAQRSKKTPTCVAVVALIASKKARTPSSSTLAAGFSIAGAHSALCFFPPPFTVVKETWQPVLPVYTSQKQAKKAHVVLRTLAFKHACSLMSCSTPACRITCM